MIFKHTINGIKTLNKIYDKGDKAGSLDALTDDEQIIIGNPMAYLAARIDYDNRELGKDLMYNLMAIYHES